MKHRIDASKSGPSNFIRDEVRKIMEIFIFVVILFYLFLRTR